MTSLLISPKARQGPGATALRYPADSVVVLAGIPGAGKSTLLRRLFPASAGVRVLDSERLRGRWQPVLGSVPYAVWRPLLHLSYYALVRRAVRGGGPLVVHECATRPWARRLIGRWARRSGLEVHLIMLDVPAEVARAGQRARARVVGAQRMDTHARRWPGLLDLAADDPGRVVPGAASAVILDRERADRLNSIGFTPPEGRITPSG